MKKLLLLLGCSILTSRTELQQVTDQLPNIGQNQTLDISGGLKEALNNGITKQVSKLTATDGFFKNEAVKILLPQELQVVDKKLRQIGMSKLADEGLKVLNRAAEDAVKEATPNFICAYFGKLILITGLNFAYKAVEVVFC